MLIHLPIIILTSLHPIAIADAIGDDAFKRSPVTADILLTSLENGGKRTHETLTAHI